VLTERQALASACGAAPATRADLGFSEAQKKGAGILNIYFILFALEQ
jgi:hypothetical protein